MRRLYLLILSFLLPLVSFADEGMWVPIYLQKYAIKQMQKLGCKLSADDIYSTDKPSLKDAIVIFGGGCTGELISSQGLVLTNYHCGYGSIQKLSSLEHDYLTDGFWAYDKSEELPVPGLTVTFLVYMKDVTNQVMKNVDDFLPIEKRNNLIDKACKEIEEKVIDSLGDNYVAEVKPFYKGNQYILIVSEVYKDVRLVGAPPSAIGKFGGDTDNWVWPRHTGDFSLFRIYANKNNEPATYSPDNVPYKPKKYFTINAGGIKQGDFTLVFGYPGYTDEYIPSYLVDNLINIQNPLRIKIRQAKLDIINKAMKSSKDLNIKYFAKQAGIANGWKKWIGQNQGLKRLNILKEKKDFEIKFQKWADTYSNGVYKNLLQDYKKYSGQIRPYLIAYYSFVEDYYFTDLWHFYKNMGKLTRELQSTKSKREKDSLLTKIYKKIDGFYKDFSPEIEKQIYYKTMSFYRQDVDVELQPTYFLQIDSGQTALEHYVDSLWTNSILVDSSRLKRFYKFSARRKRKIKNFYDDPIVQMLSVTEKSFYYTILPKFHNYSDKLDSLNRLFMKAQMQMQPDKTFYPDANFTMRVSYGKVTGSKPEDGLIYNYFTTLDGVIAKGNLDVIDYVVPQKLEELYEKKDYGQWADKNDGKIHVCFLANNHTTGGNSGSPVINANGELIGVNFDRCWQGTMSDIKFDTTVCRNISLDIRYMLFIVDKYAGAKNLISEMNIKH